MSRYRSTRFIPIFILLTISLTACAPANPTGETLYRALVGGPEIGAATLLRFYAWHVMAIPLLMGALIVWHGFRVRRDGGISSPEPDQQVQETQVSRRVFARQETLTFFMTLAVLILLVVFIDPPLGPPANPGALAQETQAPWIFLWVQELLRVWPPAIAGVLTPLAIVLLISALPYMDWSNEGIALWFNRQGRIPQIVMGVIFMLLLALTIQAALR